MTPEEARSRFAAAPVARLGTLTPDGAPHLVPVTFALDGDRIVTALDAKPKRGGRLERLQNIAADPRVSLLADHYDDDWARLWWARADGLARLAERGAELERAFELLRERYRQYRSVELIGPAVWIDVERWTGWSAAG